MNQTEIAQHYSRLIQSRYREGNWCNCPTCLSEICRDLVNEYILVSADLPFVPIQVYAKWLDSYCENLDKSTYNRDLYDGYISGSIKYLYDIIRENELRLEEHEYEEPVHCIYCGKIHEGEDSLSVPRNFYIEDSSWHSFSWDSDRTYLCPSCQSDVRTCDDCGELFRVQKGYVLYTNDIAEDYESPEIGLFSDMAYHDNFQNTYKKYTCSDCIQMKYQMCRCCNKYFKTDSLPTILHGIDYHPVYPVCRNCTESREAVCEFCGDLCYSGLNAQSHVHVIHESDRTRPTDGDGNYIMPRRMIGRYDYVECNDCYEDGKTIHSYEWKPKPLWRMKRKIRNDNMLFYGCEFEAEFHGRADRRERAKDFVKRYGKTKEFYLKNDSSLDNGWEIVSHPYTWSYYKDRRALWDDIILWLVDHEGVDIRQRDNCGLHFHMSKKAFTTLHLFKFVQFFYDKNHRDFIYNISGRDNGDYARFYDVDQDGTKRMAKMKNNMSDERHSAINLTNPITLEVRTFGNFYEPLQFHKNMEFLQSLYEFSRDTSVKTLSLEDYMKYITSTKHQARFRSLVEFTKWEDNECV